MAVNINKINSMDKIEHIKTVYKIPVDFTPRQVLKLPKGSEILGFQSKPEKIFLLLLADMESNVMEDRIIGIYGEGHNVGCKDHDYLGNFELDNGAYLYHAFELFE